MATYYVDPDSGAAANSGLSPALAVALVSQLPTLNAGDTVKIKRGTTHNETITVARDGTEFNRITFTSYYNSDGSDNTGVARPIIVCGASSDGAVMFHNCSGLVFENLQVTAPTTSGNGNGFYGYAQSAGSGYHITIRNCHAFNTKGNGIGIGPKYRTGTAVSPRFNNLIENCSSLSTGGIGIGAPSGKVTDTIVRNCVVDGACQTADLGGLYTGNVKASLASGGSTFSVVAGFIYSRTFTKAQFNSATTGSLDYISAVSIASETFASFGSMLTLNTATPTTPAPGEFGYVAGATPATDPITLYVNLGVVNTSYPAMYVYPDLSACSIYDCEVKNTQVRSAECFALYLDDASVANVRGCWIHDNEARGVMIHRGTGCVIQGCVIENNGSYGIASTGGMNTKIYNNIIRNNADNGINIATAATNNIVRNNIIQGNAIGINGRSDTVASNNCFYGNSSTVAGFASAGSDVTSDPALVNDRIGSTSSALYHTGLHTGYRLDFDGGQFWNPPSIGAYEYVPQRNIAPIRGTRV